jgi:hypothetical protein
MPLITGDSSKRRARAALALRTGAAMGIPSRLNVIIPASKAESQIDDKSSPLYTLSRSESVSHSAHGTMCDARSNAGSVMPVNGQVPFH